MAPKAAFSGCRAFVILVIMRLQKLFIGGWFQRTTLHLSEMWDFFEHGSSHLDFDPKALAKLRAGLKIAQVAREQGELEYLSVQTESAVSFRVYEDGLMVLERDIGKSLKKDAAAIKEYYDGSLAKAISYIFSKGAPVPKELANIATILPYIVTVEGAALADAKKLFKEFDDTFYSHVSSDAVEVYRGSNLILINNLHQQELARELIETQIFFREFKTQLYRYLTIHRAVWEKIGTIKERGNIKGNEVGPLRAELADYQKTITLIGARIEQMDAYLDTRQKLANSQALDERLRPLFQFKFETLRDTHRYIQDLWAMTREYLNSALEVFAELQQRSTKSTISSLQLITTIGVVSGIIGYLGRDTLPNITLVGLGYFALLMGLTWLINTAISRVYRNRSYVIKLSGQRKIE